MASASTQDDLFIILNSHPTNQTRLVSVQSILDNDTFTAPVTFNFDPSEVSIFVDSEGYIVIPSEFTPGTVEFVYTITDGISVTSNQSAVSFVTFDFGPRPENEIPVIPTIASGSSQTLVTTQLIFDTLNRITYDLDPSVGTDLIISIWLSSDEPGTLQTYNASEFFTNYQSDPTFADYTRLFTSSGNDTVNIRYSFRQDFDYTITRDFTVTNLSPGMWSSVSLIDSTVPAPVPAPVPASQTGVFTPANIAIAAIAAVGIMFLLILLGIV